MGLRISLNSLLKNSCDEMKHLTTDGCNALHAYIFEGIFDAHIDANVTPVIYVCFISVISDIIRSGATVALQDFDVSVKSIRSTVEIVYKLQLVFRDTRFGPTMARAHVSAFGFAEIHVLLHLKNTDETYLPEL